jgi:hypothetical protein
MEKTRYKRIPVEVDAIQWTGDNIKEIERFLSGTPHIITPCHHKYSDFPFYVDVYTKKGLISSRKDDYFVREENGEIDVYSLKDFKRLYEEV